MIVILATLCRLAAPYDCHNQVVTTSEVTEISMGDCMHGMPKLVEWAKAFPAYQLKGWRCIIGKREERA